MHMFLTDWYELNNKFPFKYLSFVSEHMGYAPIIHSLVNLIDIMLSV